MPHYVFFNFFVQRLFIFYTFFFHLNHGFVSVVLTERCSPPQVFSGTRFPGAVEALASV
jgi:hypothetical protein